MNFLANNMRTMWIVCGACILAGCGTVRHPVAYRGARPEWTFDVALMAEQDLPEGYDKYDYQLFLGVESASCATEEGARMGALLNAIEQAKIFLHSRGELALNHLLSAGERTQLRSRRTDRDRFYTLLDTYADSELAHVEAIHWYIEEHCPVWRFVWPFSADTRSSCWRAWCVAAVPRKLCDQIMEQALRQYGQGGVSAENRDTGTGDGGTALPSLLGDPTEPYGRRVARTARRGVSNLFGAPMEIINQPFVCAAKRTDENEILQFAGFVEGVPVGVVMAGLRAVDGTASLVSAPFGGYSPALVSPETLKLAPIRGW